MRILIILVVLALTGCGREDPGQVWLRNAIQACKGMPAYFKYDKWTGDVNFTCQK